MCHILPNAPAQRCISSAVRNCLCAYNKHDGIVRQHSRAARLSNRTNGERERKFYSLIIQTRRENGVKPSCCHLHGITKDAITIHQWIHIFIFISSFLPPPGRTLLHIINTRDRDVVAEEWCSPNKSRNDRDEWKNDQQMLFQVIFSLRPKHTISRCIRTLDECDKSNEMWDG